MIDQIGQFLLLCVFIVGSFLLMANLLPGIAAIGRVVDKTARGLEDLGEVIEEVSDEFYDKVGEFLDGE